MVGGWYWPQPSFSLVVPVPIRVMMRAVAQALTSPLLRQTLYPETPKVQNRDITVIQSRKSNAVIL